MRRAFAVALALAVLVLVLAGGYIALGLRAPTPPVGARQRALDAVVRRVVAAGGLAAARPAPSISGLTVADPAALRACVAAEPAGSLPPVRDVLVERLSQTPLPVTSPGLIGLLSAIGDVAGDARASAFAVYFAADSARTRSDAEAAIAGLEDAAGRFQAIQDRFMRVRCLNELGPVADQLGTDYQVSGDFAKALGYHRKALDGRLESRGEHHPDVADSYNNIATDYYLLGEPARALEFYLKSVAVGRESVGARHPAVGGSYNNIANAYSALGDPANALEYHKKALFIMRIEYGERHPRFAESFQNIAEALSAADEPAKALEYTQKALAIQLEAQGERHEDVATCYHNIGEVYRELGEPQKALESEKKALSIRREVLGDRHPTVAGDYESLAIAYLDMGEPARALELGRQALEIRRDTLGERHPATAQIYSNLAACYLALGRTAEAIDFCQKAIEINLAALGGRHPAVASAYHNLARAQTMAGRHDRARESLDRGLRALRRDSETARGGATPAARRLVASPLTVKLLLARGQCSEAAWALMPDAGRDALADYLDAADLLEQLRGPDGRTAFGGASKADLVHLGEATADLSPRIVGVAARLSDAGRRPQALVTALEAVERGASRVFLRDLGQSHARTVARINPERLAEADVLEAKLRRLDERIGQEQVKPAERRDREAVAKLLEERDDVERRRAELVARMERDFPQYAALRYPRPCTLDQARDCLADDEVALLYVTGTEESFLLVLEKRPADGSAGVTVHRLPPSDRIAEQVAALMQEKVLDDADATAERSRALYREILAPAAGAIEGKHLVIVAGGPLGGLPFALLVEPDGDGKGRFLVERHRIRYTPSLTALHFVGLLDRSRDQPGRPLWALGDPVYSPEDGRIAARATPSEGAEVVLARLSRGTRGAALGRLLASGDEVERVAELMGAGPGDRLTGSAATEAAVKALSASGALAEYRYIHFACHGVLGLADGTQPGLVLAQAGDQLGEDGYLRLDEVANLRLNADLVALSACQTGRGAQYRAEGVSSLGRAFLYAGCRGVLCSLWSVDDQATTDLMVDLYSSLKAGKVAGEALRDAQLKMIADGEPPLHWAPFVLIGQ